MVALINSTRDAQQSNQLVMNNMQRLQALLNEFLVEQELGEEWNQFLEDKENAVQEQQTEEVSVQEQAESSKETSEAPKKEKK